MRKQERKLVDIAKAKKEFGGRSTDDLLRHLEGASCPIKEHHAAIREIIRERYRDKYSKISTERLQEVLSSPGPNKEELAVVRELLAERGG